MNSFKLALGLVVLAAAGSVACTSSTDEPSTGNDNLTVVTGVPDLTPPPKSCGGFAGATCGAGQFCDYALDDICGGADALGTCKDVPQVCFAVVDPVCGCDGKTYGNGCKANAAGTAVAKKGACEPTKPEPRSCGGFAGLTCGAGEFCDYELAHMCGAADHLGTCKRQPDACIALFDPVCGCDNNTYSNSCQANAAGVAVAREGACQP